MTSDASKELRPSRHSDASHTPPAAPEGPKHAPKRSPSSEDLTTTQKRTSPLLSDRRIAIAGWIIAFIAMVFAAVALYPAKQSLDLAQWTALKDYREQCKTFLESGGQSAQCEHIIASFPPSPPHVNLASVKRTIKRAILSNSTTIPEDLTSLRSFFFVTWKAIPWLIVTLLGFLLFFTTKGLSLADVTDRYHGRTALHRAASGGHEAVVQLLVECGADVNAKDKYHGRTALHRAAEGGHEAVVWLLLDRGADVNAKDDYGRTALRQAAEGGQEAVVRLLLDSGADVNANDDYGRTALGPATEGGHEAVVRLLKSAGAS